MQLPLTLILGTLGFAAALAAAPVGIQNNTASLFGTAAFAAGNGNGGGNGHGRGHGRGHGGGQGLDENISVSADTPGKSGSAPGHGGTSNGQAFGHDAVSGVESHSSHLNGSVKGNLNASNASAQAFAHASSNSMVGAIREAVQQSFVSGSDDDTVIGRDEIDLDALEAALAGISNKDVDENVADAIAEKVDGKVSEPAAP